MDYLYVVVLWTLLHGLLVITVIPFLRFVCDYWLWIITLLIDCPVVRSVGLLLIIGFAFCYDVVVVLLILIVVCVGLIAIACTFVVAVCLDVYILLLHLHLFGYLFVWLHITFLPPRFICIWLFSCFTLQLVGCHCGFIPVISGYATDLRSRFRCRILCQLDAVACTPLFITVGYYPVGCYFLVVTFHWRLLGFVHCYTFIHTRICLCIVRICTVRCPGDV